MCRYMVGINTNQEKMEQKIGMYESLVVNKERMDRLSFVSGCAQMLGAND